MLWGGKVADPDASDPQTIVIRELNKLIHEDQRVELCMLPVGDGLSIGRKK